MRITFRNQLALLQSSLTGFDTKSITTKGICLEHLHALPLVLQKDLISYHDTLLFIIAYPGHADQLKLAEKELLRVTRILKNKSPGQYGDLENSGMPFTQTRSRFSHDAIRWLMSNQDCTVTLEGFKDESLKLNDILRTTLPTLERSETTAGYDHAEIMDALRVPAARRLSFILDEFARFDPQPFVKDLLFEGLAPVVLVTPRNKSFSIAYNRLPDVKTYFHQDLLKKIDPLAILDSPMPDHLLLSGSKKEYAIRVVKNAMALTGRETDPCTYLDERTFRLYELERGISVAIFTMIAPRQLPLESYVGYTAFKNGLPVSYGGAWIFGERANFGINIFKPFRSGESSYIMAQLLRLYRHVFHVNYFEVEPYQYGLDNPEGISSGAFWFYYRFGFRPLDKSLAIMARKEAEKIKARKNYKTGEKVLLAFTGSNVVLSFDGRTPPSVQDVSVKVTRMITRVFKSSRLQAETVCREKFLDKAKIKTPTHPNQKQVLTEVALWAEAMKITSPAKLNLMVKMIKTKPVDVFAYQEVLLSFFKRKI